MSSILKYQLELDAAYRNYYRERHELQDSNCDPSSWELPLWEKWEKRFFEIYLRHFT